VRYRKRTAKGWEIVRDASGHEASITIDTLPRIKAGAEGDWTRFERVFTVPKALRSDGALAVVLQSQAYPRQDGVGFFELDDVCVEPLAAEKPPPVAPPVTVTVRRDPVVPEYDPLVYQEPFDWEIRDGLFYRNGKPFFFAGYGSETGAGMDSPTGLWLAKLQGIRFVSLYHHPTGTFRKTEAETYEYTAGRHPGWTSWQREANRL